ncbi:hypothetical protein M3Y97_00190200 [Aphelenchoides bicaudatus]|nr:hypothetical protein M3Y97_00190200 [Aphelenchoides bicaudatus]
MNAAIQCSSQQLKKLVYACQQQNHIDLNEYYQNASTILSKLLECSFNDEGRRFQISSGVVVDVAQLLVYDVLKWNSTHPCAFQLRYQIAKLLINLTYRAIDCKKTLCFQIEFIKTVCVLIGKNLELARGYSDLLRNLSWNGDKEISLCLNKTVQPLATASVLIAQRRLSNPNFTESRSSNSSTFDDEKTLKSIYSTLWNLALPSLKARETMCSIKMFLHYLIEWLQDYNSCPSLIEPVVGLTKCLVDQIYKLNSMELRQKYVKGLMDLIATQAGQSKVDLTRNLLSALCLCLKHKNDEVTNRIFFETRRLQHDLRQLLSKSKGDQQLIDRIQELLQHVSYCSGLYKGRADQTPLPSPLFDSPTYPRPPQSFVGQQHSFAQSHRPKMPLTSFVNPNSPRINTYANPQPLFTPTSFTLTPPSHESSMHSSADSKMGIGSRKHEDMKSSGYSENSSTGSELFHQQYQRHNQNPHFKFSNEYAEPKKQAFIRNLHPTGLQLNQEHSNWTSPTNSSAISSMYENHDVIVAKGSNENFHVSTSAEMHQSPDMYNRSYNYYQNEDTVPEGAEEFCQSEQEIEHYGSHESLYCNGRSQHPSMTSISTMPFCQSEGISPKSLNLSPINEDDINESDSASQRGILIEKNGSLNTTPRTTSTVGCAQKNDENSRINQNLLNLKNLQLHDEEQQPFNQTF